MRLGERDSKTNNSGLTRKASVRNKVSEAHFEWLLVMKNVWLEEKRKKGGRKGK